MESKKKVKLNRRDDGWEEHVSQFYFALVNSKFEGNFIQSYVENVLP